MKTLLLISLLIAAIAFCAVSCSSTKVFDSETIAQLKPDDYVAKMESMEKEYYIIDVRTKMEYKSGHIKEAINASYLNGDFGEAIRLLDQTKPVFLYCQTAHRSPLAAKKLKKIGFVEIYDLAGGFKALSSSAAADSIVIKP